MVEVVKELQQFIEAAILPCYDRFDAAHQRNHDFRRARRDRSRGDLHLFDIGEIRDQQRYRHRHGLYYPRRRDHDGPHQSHPLHPLRSEPYGSARRRAHRLRHDSRA